MLIFSGEEDILDDGKGGEVRRIVWRNRFEKTYETQDSSKHPTVCIMQKACQQCLIPLVSV